MSALTKVYRSLALAVASEMEGVAACERAGRDFSATAHRGQAGGLRIAMVVVLGEMDEAERREVGA